DPDVGGEVVGRAGGEGQAGAVGRVGGGSGPHRTGGPVHRPAVEADDARAGDADAHRVFDEVLYRPLISHYRAPVVRCRPMLLGVTYNILPGINSPLIIAGFPAAWKWPLSHPPLTHPGRPHPNRL